MRHHRGRVLAALLMLTLSIVGCGGTRSTGDSSRGDEALLARVNGQPIARDEFDRRIARRQESFTRRGLPVPEIRARRDRTATLERIIDDALMAQACAAAGIAADPIVVETRFVEYARSLPASTDLDTQLQRQGTTAAEVRSKLAHELAANALLARHIAARVSDDEVRAHYEANRERYVVKAQLRARAILVKVRRGAAEAARLEAEEIHQAVTAPGADFAAIARARSDARSAARGGDMGYFGRGDMAPVIEEAAFALARGEVSEPVLSRFGWHIIKVIVRIERREKAFTEVEADIRRELSRPLAPKVKIELRDALRAAAEIEVLLDEPIDPLFDGAGGERRLWPR